MNVIKLKEKIISSGEKAVKELIKVAEERIILDEDGIGADKLKNAAQAKKLAIFDALEILSKIEEERNIIEEQAKQGDKQNYDTFAERRAK
jgi:hypothetical protein